jgi:3-methyladenine DNA glycosylase/8-oxoguanine DNA glycosylase
MRVRSSFGAADRVRTYLRPPALSSLPRERDQLEFSSRSLVFPRDGGQILRAWGPPERPWVVGVEEEGERWRVSAWGADARTARRAVIDLFSLDHPIEEFYRQVRVEPVLAGAERRFRGLRLPRDPNLYEALVHAVVGQQLSVRAANTIKGRIIASAGSMVEVEGTEVARIPTPSELLRIGEPGLRAAGASGAKARSLLGFARRRRSGGLVDADYARLDSASAVERLDEEPGVGRWTAENALLRGIGRRDLFVAGDLGLRAALERFGAVPRSAPEAAARAWGDRHYPGWGSYATLYLWRKLVADMAAGARAAEG